MSPLPLGIIGAVGDFPLVQDFVHLQTTTLTANATSIVMSGIPQNYKHLQIRAVFRSSNAWTGEDVAMFFNGSTGTWSYHRLRGNTTTVSTNGYTSSGSGGMMSTVFLATATNDPASSFGGGVIDILNYSSTSLVKTVRSLGGARGTIQEISLNSGGFYSSNAINAITFRLQGSGSWVTGSRVSIYGIKG